MRQICQIRSGSKINDWNPLLKKFFRAILYNFLQFSLMSCLISGKDNSFWSFAIYEILFLAKVRSPFKFYFEKFPSDVR